MSRRGQKPLLQAASERATDRPVIARDWYKDAIIYELHIKSFYDSDNDGIGDFAGLTQKLDYLRDLGVTAVWLLPFYPSPLRDDGYDIAEYKDINPSYGTMADFKAFVREAHRRGLRVITELVINHTSDQHPWFLRARRAKAGSSHRNFYVWSDTDQRYLGTRIIFLDTETSNWAWDPVAKAYYWHRFYSHQPDLNFDNPAVVRAVLNVMRFWLDLGVDGLRLDAVPYLVEREGTNNENLPETHGILRTLRAEIDASYPDKMLLAEANQWPEDVLPYFGKGDQCHMAFHFPLMPRIYMAVAQEDRHPITDIMRQTPDIPEGCQWAIFLRNHDELTLEMVTDRERDYLWDVYAVDRRMRINLGIRRRLAPLMQNDRRRIDLLNSILFSMPGTPVLYYGDEIGMGDNFYLGDRDGVRTPMQWSPDRNGGFSRADPARLFLPAIQDAEYGFLSVNVEAQSRSPTSMLNSIRRLMAVRRDLKSMGRGKLTFLYPLNRKLLAYVRSIDDELVLCVVNLSRAAQSVELDLSAYRGRVPVELLGLSTFPPILDRPYHLTMAGHSFFWFKLMEPSQIEGGLAMLEVSRDGGVEPVTLVLRSGWDEFLTGAAASELGRAVLRQFLPTQRWFAAKDVGVASAQIVDAADLPRRDADEPWSLAIVETTLADGRIQHYQMPFGLVWGAPTAEARAAVQPMTLAHVRRFRAEGALYDGGIHPGWALAAIEAIGAGREMPFRGGGKAAFRPSSKFAERPFPSEPAVRQLGVEQSNSSIAVQDYGVLKLYRRLEDGVHPEIEMCRFLTGTAGFTGTPPLLGTIERLGRDGTTTALGILTGYVANQGDAWSYAQDHLKRVLQERWNGTGEPAHAEQAPADPHAYFLELMGRLGYQTAELHRALCPSGDTDPAFAPEPITPADLARWRQETRASAEALLGRLASQRTSAPDPAVDRLLTLGDRLLQRIDAACAGRVQAVKTRLHGDYHLGQVLVAQNDFSIIDFEGEPRRTLDERREKHTPLKDVAGMIRSIDYAAAAAVRAAADLPSVDNAALEAMCRDWRDRATAAFLAAYRGTIAGTACWPADERDADALIELMLIDKALYEIGYELANRPAWLGIPIQGIVDLLTRADEAAP
ncbi:alpha-amylase [Aliidongia dinghuensis]|uniref:Maltokinase n=1 Tax=Aliidongia dinghuensis TaxID=1867774 RepID=A0A8J2YQP9_9PROT|nr:maltose alpha-D-glucosyltransferase [Aliidongia dinghuensis]GGF04861.1 alpha-amylase [Aliidongia dinghuensis]